MARKKILVITGSRAEYGLLRPVIRNIKKSRTLSLRLLVTGMHTLKTFGSTLNDVKKEFKVDCVVPIKENTTMNEALADEIRGIDAYVKKEKPDIILVLGDRDEALAGAIVGGHNKIVVAHIHGGDTLGYLVDEAIRHSITKFAHVHFPATKVSARRIAQMGEEKNRIHAFGSTAFGKSELRNIPDRKQLAEAFRLDVKKDWLLAVQHPTPLDPTPLSKQLDPTLRALKKHSSQKIIIYPNSDTGSEIFIRKIEALRNRKDTVIVKTLPRERYLGFLKECSAIVGNSSSGIIEAGYFKKPVINIGGRQTGRECGQNVMHVGYDEHAIARSLVKALSPSFRRAAARAPHPYGSGDASKKIVSLLEKLKVTNGIFYKRFTSV
jgi:UDP-hydrolysing UDP-N-acetyl-D-glucosamine 2-epimerase